MVVRGIITVSVSVEWENRRDAMVTLVIRVEIILHAAMFMVENVLMDMDTIVIVIVIIDMALLEITGHLEKVIVHADMEIGRKASASKFPSW